jgi:hypothetical protein
MDENTSRMIIQPTRHEIREELREHAREQALAEARNMTGLTLWYGNPIGTIERYLRNTIEPRKGVSLSKADLTKIAATAVFQARRELNERQFTQMHEVDVQ